MNTTCEELGPLLSAHLDDELDPVETAVVEEHLVDCARCQRRLAGLRRSIGMCRDGMPEIEPTAGFLMKLHERLEAEPTPDSAREPIVDELGGAGPLVARPAGTPLERATAIKWVAAAAIIALIIFGARQIERSLPELMNAWGEHGTEMAERPGDEIVPRDGSDAPEGDDDDGAATDPRRLPEGHDVAGGTGGGEGGGETVGGGGSPEDDPGATGATDPGGEGGDDGADGGATSRPKPDRFIIDDILDGGGPEGPKPRSHEPQVPAVPEVPDPEIEGQPIPEEPSRPRRRAITPEQRREAKQLIALVRNRQTPAEERASALIALGELDDDETYELLEDVLAGKLDGLPSPELARRSAFFALGRLGTVRAGELAIDAGLQGPGRSERPEARAARRAEARVALATASAGRRGFARWLGDEQLGTGDEEVLARTALVGEALAYAGPRAIHAANGAVTAFESLAPARRRRRPKGAAAARASLAEALGGIRSLPSAKILATALTDEETRDPSWQVREQLATALGRIGAMPAAAHSGFREGGSIERTTREVSISALATAMNDDDEDERVREAAALALGDIHDVGAFEALVTALPKSGDVRGADRALYGCQVSSMYALTGRGFSEPKAWREFWAEEGGVEAIQPVSERNRAPRDGSPPKITPMKWESDEAFFELPTLASKALFLVDVSDSMRHEGRMDLLRAELRRTIPALPTETRFAIWTFADGVQRWQDKAVTPTDKTKRRVVKNLAGLRARSVGQTNLAKALQAALEADFDTIFLLTDGKATAGAYTETLALADRITAWNERRARIHTVGLFRGKRDLHIDRGGDRNSAADLLREVARRNKGLFIRN